MNGARMQEIADEAGINKALLHYYFRNKEKLFEELERYSMLESVLFKEVIVKAPKGDVSIFGLANDLHFSFMREVTEMTNSSCLFVRDSGKESAIA